MPIATMLTTMPGENTAVNSRAERIAGKPCTASTRRMSVSSIQPPTQPLASPSETPTPAPMPTAMTPTASEVTAPVMIRERRSRPK